MQTKNGLTSLTLDHFYIKEEIFIKYFESIKTPASSLNYFTLANVSVPCCVGCKNGYVYYHQLNNAGGFFPQVHTECLPAMRCYQCWGIVGCRVFAVKFHIFQIIRPHPPLYKKCALIRFKRIFAIPRKGSAHGPDCVSACKYLISQFRKMLL